MKKKNLNPAFGIYPIKAMNWMRNYRAEKKAKVEHKNRENLKSDFN